MSSYALTAIDFTRLPAPSAIEAWTPEQLIAAGKARFLEHWAEEQAIDPSLPDFTESVLETHPSIITLRTFAGLRGIDRQRVNDAFRALLAPLAKGSNLDQIAGSRNIERLVVTPATATSPAIMQSDASLLRDYLLSFDLPAAGSRDRYLFEAFRAWPQSADRALGLWDARVNGRVVHGRPGDVDIVLAGPFGRVPTAPELAQVRAAVTAPNVKPEAVSVNVLPAVRVEYQKSLVLDVPAGPDPILVVNEARARVLAVATERTVIGGEIPTDLISGAAYGASIIAVRDETPLTILPDPYKIPVLTDLEIVAEIR